MGCAHSKLDDLPAVALCRERCASLDDAIRLRYVLSQSHLAYTHSLKAVGASLLRFFDRDLDHFTPQPPSPLLNLPAHRKGDPQPSSPVLNLPSHPKSATHRHSHSSSGSHLHFHSDEDDDADAFHHHDDDSASASPLHYPHDNLYYGDGPSSPPQRYGHPNYPDTDSLGFPGSYPTSYPGGGGTFMHMNYMRNQTTPSVSFQQRPIDPEIVRMGMMGEASPSNSNPNYYPYPYSQSSQNPNFYPTSFPNYTNYGNGVFPGSSSVPSYYASSSSAPPIGPSSSKEPPPPPSPPTASAWEFLNPFDSYDRHYPAYTPTRDFREIRKEEGIPDLEEEDYQHEVVKEIQGDQKFVDGSSNAGANLSYPKASLDEYEDEDGKGANNSEAMYRTKPVKGMDVESDAAEYEVHMVDKKVVHDDERSGVRANAAGFKGNFEVVRQIQFQFERASESGNELAKILEVGKLPYNRKHPTYQAKVASKMLHAITPPLSVISLQHSTSKSADKEIADPALLDAEVDLNLRSRNLSSTLQKLHLWEKKLYEEVKVEEKMRILHERKCRKLKRLDETGAEAHKVDATRALVKSLSTKIRIAIQVVDKISVKINGVRDEELWPQLHEFIHGLSRMWKSMLECHHNQFQAIGEAKHLDAITSGKHFSEAHVEATSQLQHEVINWTVAFSCWIGSQKDYVRALNNWLMKCLLYVPEETPDGIVPFSPGRIGAPPVFVICNQWSQALDRVSEKELLDSMRDFASSVLHLWERDKLEMRGRMTANKDADKRVKDLEREDQKIHKEMHALEKRMVMASGDDNGLSLTGHIVYQSDASKSGSVQVSLQRTFEAMERFTANSLKVYEELLQRIEEVLAREPEKAS